MDQLRKAALAASKALKAHEQRVWLEAYTARVSRMHPSSGNRRLAVAAMFGSIETIVSSIRE